MNEHTQIYHQASQQQVVNFVNILNKVEVRDQGGS